MTNQEDIVQRINNRIKELQEELEELVSERDSLSKRIEQINIQLTQIIGGIKELSTYTADEDK